MRFWIPVLKASVFTGAHGEGPTKYGPPLGTPKENLLSTSISAYFQKRKKMYTYIYLSICIYIYIKLPLATQKQDYFLATSLFSPFCMPLHGPQPPPPKSDRTERSQLRNWVVMRSSTVPFSSPERLRAREHPYCFPPK